MRNLIVGLARPMMRLLRRDERGGIGVFIAILIGAGVLLGMGAVVVDVGQLYQNRAELQNGADSAALAVANTCALSACDPTVAQSYANGNTSALTQHQSTVDGVCGSAVCQVTNPMTSCPPNPTAQNTNYVDVQTSTYGNNGLLPPAFARMLLGESSYPGTHLQACAQAEWGGPSVANSVGFTISACEWDYATKNGTFFPPTLPPWTPPATAIQPYDYSATLHSGATSGQCQYNPADSDAPGAFGWLQNKNTNCQVTISQNGTYYTGTGVDAGYCADVLAAAWANQTVLYVPVYSSVCCTNGGSNTYYVLKGFAAFVVTGYRLPGGVGNNATKPDWLNPKLLCGPPNVCIDGVFVQALCTTNCPGMGGGDLGLSVVRLTG